MRRQAFVLKNVTNIREHIVFFRTVFMVTSPEDVSRVINNPNIRTGHASIDIENWRGRYL